MNPKILRNLPILVIALLSFVASMHAQCLGPAGGTQICNISVFPTTLMGDGSDFAAASVTIHIPAGNAGGSAYFIPNGNVGSTAMYCSTGRYATSNARRGSRAPRMSRLCSISMARTMEQPTFRERSK